MCTINQVYMMLYVKQALFSTELHPLLGLKAHATTARRDVLALSQLLRIIEERLLGMSVRAGKTTSYSFMPCITGFYPSTKSN